MEITDKEFWTNYWGNITIPVTVDYQLKNDRVIAQTIKKHVPSATDRRWAIEVGCAPGKWLIFLNKELNYNVVGYEYVAPAAEKTVQNLLSQNISTDHFKIITGDFNKDTLQGAYDLVVSLGFIEHFTDLDAVLAKHLKILNEKGYLVIGVPNFKGINYPIQKIVDRYLADKMLPHHNLDAMDVNRYLDFARDYKLDPLFVGYVGGFERGLFDVNAITNTPLRILMKIMMRSLTFLFGRSKSSFFNGYMIAILRK